MNSPPTNTEITPVMMRTALRVRERPTHTLLRIRLSSRAHWAR